MSAASTIEWTDATWNPVRGCSIVSKGCTNCYAMKQAHRQSGQHRAYAGLTTLSKGGPVWTGEVRTVPELLDAPLHWKKPRRIFVNSMSDLFHEAVDLVFIGSVLGIAAACPQHTFQVLTKRPQRMLEVLSNIAFLDAYESSHDMYADTPAPWPARNLWLGVSVEDQASAEERIPLLLQTPAAVRWISAEPLLGLLDLTCVKVNQGINDGLIKTVNYISEINALTGEAISDLGFGYDGKAKLDWIVAGGESGPGARPMRPDWARSLRDQCAAAGVAYFFKQWGAWTPCLDDGGHIDSPREKQIDGAWMLNVGKRGAGRLLDGREHNDYPA